MAKQTALARRAQPTDAEVMGAEVQILQTHQLASIVRAETDSQIETAHAFPRDVQLFLAEAEAMATIDEELASECIYALERKDKSGGKKVIKGPSVRLAEIMAACYRNARIGARIAGDDGKMLTAQGVAHDLEKNVAYTIEVMRRVVDSNGKRYNEDMIATTGNAAVSIALRNAVFRMIPKIYVKRIQDRIEAFIADKQGTGKKLQANAAKALAWFTEQGIDTERVLRKLGRESIERVTAQDIVTLRGFGTSIAQGQATIESLFPAPGKVEAPKLAQADDDEDDTNDDKEIE